jgi:hypothetical protein
MKSGLPMTEPQEPDRPPQEPTGASQRPEDSADWRGSWKRAADGTWYQDTEGGRTEGEGPGRSDQDSGDAGETGEQAQQPAGKRRLRPKWTTVGFIVVAGLLIFAAVHAFTGAGNQSALNPGSAPPVPEQPPIVLGAAATSPPMVTLNPGLVRQGARVGITGIGFTPGSFVDLQFTPDGSRQPMPVPGGPVAPDGSFVTGFVVPQLPDTNGGVVTAVQRGSTKNAQAHAQVQTGAGFMALSYPAGRPGDVLAVTANGFQPGEKIDAYWARIGGPPAAQLQADQGGGLAHAPLRVGVAPAGNATLILVGEQSRTTATASFTMIGLYPQATPMPYAVRPAQPFSISGNGFMPGEQVRLYLNNASGPPVTELQADQRGIVVGPRFVAPYQLKGRQMVTLIGEQSRATATSGFQIMPFTPQAQPSTWGGMPGTSMSFYASGFAPNEVVLVYAGRGPGNPGVLVSAFRVDARGIARGGGHYTIPPNTQGMTSLQLVGRQSDATATASLSVQGAPGVHVPPTPPYVLPPELATDPPPPGSPPQPPAPPSGPR